MFLPYGSLLSLPCPKYAKLQAIYDADNNLLGVSTYAADSGVVGTQTTFTVERLHEPAQARLLRDGQDYEGWRVSGDDRIEVKAEVQDHAYLVLCG